MCRIDAKLRRVCRHDEPDTIEAGRLRIDTRNFTAHLGEKPLALRPKEFGLLTTLASSNGRIKQHHELARAVWGKKIIDRRTLGAHVSRLRSALARNAPTRDSDHAYIECVRGLGYRFHSDEPRSPPSRIHVRQDTVSLR